MDLPRIFTVRESGHRIHNPLTAEKSAALGRAPDPAPGTRALDLASGSGEMLCTWARDHRITGTGVDISTEFTAKARARAAGLGVADRVVFHHGDASGYVADEPVGLAACVGATWIGIRRWLDRNPDDGLAAELRAELSTDPVRYTRYAREYLGWGVFALMPR